MTTFLLILLALGVVGGLVLRKQKNTAAVPVLVSCCVLAVVVSLARMLGGGGTSLSAELEMTRYAAALELGRHLAETSAGNSALCILNPVDSGSPSLQEGLETGLDGRIQVAFSMLDREAVMGPDAMGLDLSVVTALLDQHPDTDLLITGGDLPNPAPKVAALLRDRKVRFAAARALDPADFALYQRAGVFAGAVIYRPDPEDIGDLKNATPEKVFSSQFRLLPAGGR
jgi:hypothetical protein